MLKSFALVGLGGALGSMARYGIAKIFVDVTSAYPLATGITNVIGCFLIGLLVGFAERNEWLQGNLLLLLSTGFCGGFTTFSAFALENSYLIQQKLLTTTILYSLGSLIFGILACLWGLSLTR
ncbi:MAG TPA: fluoride efflux transporter CrcB [Flavipsychrobacter sp.]|nr:fluoride efflux transporter CrcB [Flavipsychrobacter sp.]